MADLILVLKSHFLFVMEATLWCCILIAVSFGRRGYPRAASAWMKFSRRPVASLLVPPVIAVILRVALLPVFPVPYPIIRDEFSYLLAADTYASGRLTNPTHPNYEHFESRHVLHKPSYMAKYPPGQGAVLALGQMLGHPWIGVLISVTAMCALLGWASRTYLTPPWTLALVTIASLRYIPLSYWANSYWGGAVAATGGCLVIGSLARLESAPSRRLGALLGLGLGVLACSRPSEGLAFGVFACMIWAVRQLARYRWRPAIQRYASSVVSAVLCVGVVLAFFAYNNKAVTGDILVMPYQAYAEQYEAPPIFVWQQPRRLEFNNERLQLAAKTDLEFAAASQGALALRLRQIGEGVIHFFWPPLLLLPVLLGGHVLLRSAPTRNLLVLIALSLLWSSLSIFFYVHYAAALLSAFLICGVQALRVLRVSMRSWSRTLGCTCHAPRFAALIVGSHLCLLAAGGIGVALDLTGRQWTLPPRGYGWCCPEISTGRKGIESQLESLAGQHLVFVRYPNNELPYLEWVYNGADIDAGRIIWAHTLLPEKDARLRARYPDRRAWTADLTRYPEVSLTPLP
jgi:hypothetical protein